MSTRPLKLHTPEELLAAVPYLLGFHPQNSLVVLTLCEDRLGLTARVDLPADPSCRAADLLTGSFLPALLREVPDAAVLLGYEDRTGDSVPVLEALTEALDANGVMVKERLVVHAGRWRSLDCPDAGCCPPDGLPLPRPVDAPSVAAEFVGAGVSPRATRADFATSVEAGVHAGAVGQLLTSHGHLETPRTVVEMAAVFARILNLSPTACPLTVEDAAVTVVILRDVNVRDALIAWLTPGTLDPGVLPPNARDFLVALPAQRSAGEENDGKSCRGRPDLNSSVQDRLIRFCTVLPDEHATAALTVLACFTWWRGDGALTRVALDRALRCDPAYRLAQLLEHMVDLGIRPTSAT